MHSALLLALGFVFVLGFDFLEFGCLCGFIWLVWLVCWANSLGRLVFLSFCFMFILLFNAFGVDLVGFEWSCICFLCFTFSVCLSFVSFGLFWVEPCLDFMCFWYLCLDFV